MNDAVSRDDRFARVGGYSWPALTSAALAAAAFIFLLAGWLAGGWKIDVAWTPAWDLRFSLELDGLAASYGLLTTGVGFAVFLYAGRYMPRHLAELGRPAREETWFFVLMTAFMLAMTGLVLAQDFILLFVFWDLTAVASYLLIGFHREQREAREAALTAILVTGVSAIPLLLAAFVLWSEFGTFALPDLEARIHENRAQEVAAALIVVAALAKSAQVPLHFWLPPAMVAPTPVSAYLHSSAMVAAGVFLLERTYPLLAPSQGILDALLVLGGASMLAGGILALTQGVMKRILAYSTVSQYGYVVFTIGVGGAGGLGAATYYVLAHGLIKSTLFLTAGAVTQLTHGEEDVGRLGGLWRRLPALATASFIASAGLAGLPLTAGFFKDELLFGAAIEQGWLAQAVAVAGAGLTFAYIFRFWGAVFLGRAGTAPSGEATGLILPTVALAVVILAAGLATGLLGSLADAGAEAALGGDVAPHLSYPTELGRSELLALMGWTAGSVLLIALPVAGRFAARMAMAGARGGPARVYSLTLESLQRAAEFLHAIELRRLRGRIMAVLLPTSLFVVIAWGATVGVAPYTDGGLSANDLPALGALILVVGAAFGSVFPKNALALALALSVVGYSLAAAYAFLGAPDVALVAALVETAFAVVFFAALGLFPGRLRDESERLGQPRRQVTFDVLITMGAAAVSFLFAWSTLSWRVPRPAGLQYLELAPEAHMANSVMAILSDFRGLDTVGEATVAGAALLAILVLLQRDRP